MSQETSLKPPKRLTGIISMSIPNELAGKIRERAAASYRSTSQYLRDLACEDLTEAGLIPPSNANPNGRDDETGN